MKLMHNNPGLGEGAREVLLGAATSRSFSAIVLSFGRIIAALLSLGTSVVLSRLLSQNEYGTYQQVWLIYATLIPFVMLGMPASVTYYIPQADGIEQKMIVIQTALLLVLAGLLTGVVLYMFAGPLAGRLGGRPLEELLRLFALFPIFALPLVFVDSMLIATHDAPGAALLAVLLAGTQFLAVVTPIAVGYDLKVVMHALNLTAVVRFLGVGWYVMRRYKGVPLVFNLSFLGRQLRYSIPLGLASIVGTLSMQLDRLIVALFFEAREYAVYVNGAIELPLVGIITGSVMSVITPEFVRLHKAKKDRELLRMWHSAIHKVAILFFPMTAFLFIFATDVVSILFSHRYTESGLFLRIYLLLLPLRITVYGSLLMAAGKSPLILKAATLGLVLNGAMSLLFVNLIGLPGAALAAVISEYAVCALMLRWCAGVLKVGFSEIFPWVALGRILAVSATAAAFIWLCTSWMSQGMIRVGVGLLLFIAISGVLMRVFDGVRAEIMGGIYEALLAVRRRA